MSVSYTTIKKQFPDVFCIDNLRSIYKLNEDELSMSFVDFLMYIEDYYLLKYSGKLSKTAWWLFSLIRYLVRYDGYVQLSYKDIMNYFYKENDSTISKPTFFKYIDELESFGIIKRYNNKKLFNSKYQNDSNTYIVIGCVDEIVKICKRITNRDEFRNLIIGVKKPKEKQRKPKQKTDKDLYAEIKEYYIDVFPALEDFFTFLAKKNKSKRIALSRKMKILTFLYERGVYNEDIEYALSQTISRNIRNEKYFFKIISKYYDEQEETDEPDEIQKKYMVNHEPSGMSDEEYKKTRRELLGDIDGYKDVLYLLKDKEVKNKNETKLYKAALIIKHKMETHDKYAKLRVRRINLLLEQYGIREMAEYDKHFNRIQYWCDEVDEDKIIPEDVMKKIISKHKELFGVYKYEMPDRRIYDGL